MYKEKRKKKENCTFSFYMILQYLYEPPSPVLYSYIIVWKIHDEFLFFFSSEFEGEVLIDLTGDF